MTQIREEVSFTKGQIIVRGKLVNRGKGKRADYILYYKPNITHAIGDGLQQALDYAFMVMSEWVPCRLRSFRDGDCSGLFPSIPRSDLRTLKRVLHLAETRLGGRISEAARQGDYEDSGG